MSSRRVRVGAGVSDLIAALPTSVVTTTHPIASAMSLSPPLPLPGVGR